MNTFNKVFLAIKEESGKMDKLTEINCVEEIAIKAGVPLADIGLYLSHLQEMGLIKFSIKDSYIYLTSFGRKHDTLEKDNLKTY